MLRALAAGLSLLTCCLATMTAGQEARHLNLYAFGNSLVNHPDGGDLTNVPVWLDALAKADGSTVAVEGHWGFLPEFPSQLPPNPEWSFPTVQRVGSGNPDDYDVVLITPTNFIQYQSHTKAFDGYNPNNTSPLGATLSVVDWVAERAPDITYYIYEGWADMDGVIRRFPPNERFLQKYHDFNRGAYQDWYVDYIADLKSERPDADIRRLPIAPILSEVMSTAPLSDLPATVFYSDDAPHGTPDTYLLAAMVTYATLYQRPLPQTVEGLDKVNPVVAGAYPAIAEQIWSLVQPYLELKRAALENIQPAADYVLPPRGARPIGEPAMGIGLNGIADWSTQHPFVDVMKTARQWVGHTSSQWGAISIDELRAGGFLDGNGWPLRLPDNAKALEALILTDQPEEALHLRGSYVLRYEGQGDIKVTGRARRAVYEDGEIRFFFEPGEGFVGIAIAATDPDDPIRNISVVHENHLLLHEAGALFNPDWLARISTVRSIRFMDWMFTNDSPVVSWEDRPRVTDYSYTAWGVPIPVMVELANQIGADPWFNMPHLADDDYVRAFAEEVRGTLDPRLKAHVEYSNEMWNFIFSQTNYAAAQAEARWGKSSDGWMQFYGMRAAQVMDIWTDVFGDETEDRLVRVFATHTGWPGLEESALMSPLGFLELGHLPRDSFDAYAVTGYFGHEIGGDEQGREMRAILKEAADKAEERGRAQGLRRVALREFMKVEQYKDAFDPVAALLSNGSVRTLVEEIFPHHARAAEAAGLDLIMYEGGSHVAAQMDRVDDEALTTFFEQFNYSPQMARLYMQLIDGWNAAGGRMFNAFVDVAAPSKWGSWGGLRHLDDANPRWDVLMAHNAGGPVDWEDRDPVAFEDGVLRAGSTGNDVMDGTAEEDTLLGGPGDDVLFSLGGSDKLHGGAGQDRAVFPGKKADYSIEKDGEVVTVSRGYQVSRLTMIEELVFADDPETVVPVN